jgi:hypothetical protein
MMALRAAQQETEGYEGVKGAIAGGMDATDPRMLQYGKRGIEAFKAAGEGRVKQQDALAKSFVNARESLSMVRTPEDLLAYTVSQFNDPLIGPRLKAQGLTPESAAANLQKELATSGFETVLKKSAMGLDGWFKDQTSRRNTDVSAGPGYQQAALAREKYKNQLAAGGDIVTTTVPDPENPGQRIEIQARRDMRTGQLIPLEVAPMPMRVDISPSSATSAYQPSGGGAPNVNALTAPNVNALNPNAPQGPTFARPKQPVRQPVAVIKDGEVTLVPPDQAVGMTPATPGAEKILEKQNIAKEGKESVNRVLSNLYSEYGNLVKSGGITDTRRSVEENIAARTGASAVGQLTGSFTGSESQSFRDTIEQTRPLLLTAIMKATGLSATQLNSNVELQTYLKTATDPKVSIQSNVKALNNISQMFGLGEKFDVPEIPKAASGTAKPEDAPPTGLSPEIAKLWPYMSPEDRKLWK